MNPISEITYYVTLMEQMMVYTFVYHHICRPKKSYWLTVGFYFACVSIVHIVFLPFGEDFMLKLFPHIMLMLAQFPVMLLYEERWWKRLLFPLLNIVFQSVGEIICALIFSAVSGVPFASLTYPSAEHTTSPVAAARILIIDVAALMALLLILLIRRDRTLRRDLLLILGFVSAHLVFLITYLQVISYALTEIGVLLELSCQLMIGILLVIQYYGALKRRKLTEEVAEVRILRQQMENNEQYYRLAESKFAEISKLRHDFQTQLRTISVMLQDPESEEASRKIAETLREHLESTKTPVFCENHTLNAVLNVKLSDARYRQLSPEILLNDCGQLPYDDYDLCSLISNLFDNAAESCLRETHPEQTELILKAGIRGGYFVIRCVNTCSVMPSAEMNTKPETGHGYGTAIIRNICEKYDGEYTIKFQNKQAIATVIMQLSDSAPEPSGKDRGIVP